MFSEEMLTKIYSQPELKNIPLNYLFAVVHVIESILDKMGYDF